MKIASKKQDINSINAKLNFICAKLSFISAKLNLIFAKWYKMVQNTDTNGMVRNTCKWYKSTSPFTSYHFYPQIRFLYRMCSMTTHIISSERGNIGQRQAV